MWLIVEPFNSLMLEDLRAGSDLGAEHLRLSEPCTLRSGLLDGLTAEQPHTHKQTLQTYLSAFGKA